MCLSEAFDDEVLAVWNSPSYSRTHELARDVYTVKVYDSHRVMTLERDNTLLMINVLNGYTGKSLKGIKIGSEDETVETRYGLPDRIEYLTQGASWVYDAHGIAFQLRDRKVVSWLVF